MRSLNLGVLAHVDAGKTSLTERLLYGAGVIDAVGSVDAGSTQTDTLLLERQRGITIKSAVVSFTLDDVTVNLVDTPGHPDFIAEVERALGVLDGAVLVVSAVEGVQAQTRILLRTLQRLRLPTLIFVNKIDRVGAAPDDVVRAISERLTPDVVAMGSTRAAGTRGAAFVPARAEDGGLREQLVDLLTRHDDDLLARAVDGGTPLSPARLRAALATQTRRALVHPVFFGSAVTGAGVDALADALPRLLPARSGDSAGPVSGTVFKVETGAAGETVAYLRLFSGTVRVRDRLRLGGGTEAKVTAIKVFAGGGTETRASVVAGEIARVHGLAGVRVGDFVGDRPPGAAGQRHFAPPSLETVVDAVTPTARGALHSALSRLAEQDPLIDVRQDDARQEISVSLYGEVQKEVIAATLAREYGVDVTFRETSGLCVERPVGTGEAAEHIGAPGNPLLATVGLRVGPAPVGSGVTFGLEVELGSMPPAFFAAVEQAVRQALREGLHGWRVVDCAVTMTRSGYWARQSRAHGTFDASMSSTAGDFRALTPLVLMTALRQAGTTVHEPVHRFELDLPADVLGTVLAALPHVDAVPLDLEVRGSTYLMTGRIPAVRVHDLQGRLPALTHGEGSLTSEFLDYQQVCGVPPERPRTDHDPLDRREYLRRAGAGPRTG